MLTITFSDMSHAIIRITEALITHSIHIEKSLKRIQYNTMILRLQNRKGHSEVGKLQ